MHPPPGCAESFSVCSARTRPRRSHLVKVRPTAAGEGGCPFEPGRVRRDSSRCGHDSGCRPGESRQGVLPVAYSAMCSPSAHLDSQLY